MKRFNKEIAVKVGENIPISFQFHDQLFEITAIEEAWVLQGNWWHNEEKRRYFRVLTDRGVAVLYFRESERESSKWFLEQIFD